MTSGYDVPMPRVVILLLIPLAIQAGPFRVVVDDATRARVARAEVTLTCPAAPAQKAERLSLQAGRGIATSA